LRSTPRRHRLVPTLKSTDVRLVDPDAAILQIQPGEGLQA
jgi:hypothetical protein